MIRYDKTSLRFGEQLVLDQIDLEVLSGNFVTILGPSGCGKSSLLRLAAGLIEPSSGSVLVEGMRASEYLKSSDAAGYVFQDPRLLPWRNVTQNVTLPLELSKISEQEQKQRTLDSLKLVGLTEIDALKFPDMLSGGMRMRVALARALVTRPCLLLLDEPFAALDDILRKQLNEELLQIWMRQRTTTLFVTHNVAEAVFLSERVVVMSTQPGAIVTQIEIPFDYPRSDALIRSTEFGRCVGMLSDALREGVAS